MRTILVVCACTACLCVPAGVSRAQLALEYSTFIGGKNPESNLHVALDGKGNVYVAGQSNSSEWIPGARVFCEPDDPDRSREEASIFVSMFDSLGNRCWTTFIGGQGNEWVNAVAADASGAYITGAANNDSHIFEHGTFPTTSAYKDNVDANGVFVAKLDRYGGDLVYSTFILQKREDSYDYYPNTAGASIAVDAYGCAYVAGSSYGGNLPVTSGMDAFNGVEDGFVLKLGPSGSTLHWLTYLGGSKTDQATGIAVDLAGNAYVTGCTHSIDFSTTRGAYKEKLTAGSANQCDAFVAKFSNWGRMRYCTYLPSGTGDGYGELNEWGKGIDVDAQGHAFVACTYGYNEWEHYTDKTDIFVAKCAPDGSTLNYRKALRGSANDYASGVAVDPAGCAYVAGITWSADFDSTSGLDRGGAASRRAMENPMEMDAPDAFVAKISSEGRCIEYATQLGTSRWEEGTGIAATSEGEAIVAGWTNDGAFPVTVDAAQAAYGGGRDGFLSELIFLSSPGYCVRSSKLRVGDRFSVEIRVPRAVKGPLDAFAFVSTNPTGGQRMVASLALNGEIHEGICALARNVPGIPAGFMHQLVPKLEIRENFIGSHTFYFVVTDANAVPWDSIKVDPAQLDMQMQNELSEYRQNYTRTVEFNRWSVEPPDSSVMRPISAEEWDELTNWR